MSAISEIEDRAAQWIIRREDPDWSASDQAELELWLSRSMAHKAAFWRLEHGWLAADRIGALGTAQVNTVPIAHKIRSWWKPAVIAASLLTTLATGSLFLHPDNGSLSKIAQSTYGTKIGGKEIVNLADGSTVELNTSSVLRTAISREIRETWLDAGEAYFDITHLEGRPFVVHAGDRKIIVLGTKFSVRRVGKKVAVSVIEGRVRVETVADRPSQAAIIGAGGTVITQGEATLLADISAQAVQNSLAWRDGRLVFDHVTLAEAADEFNRYNQDKIVIADPDTAATPIGGTFQASNVHAFVRLLGDAYGLKVDTERDVIKISR